MWSRGRSYARKWPLCAQPTAFRVLTHETLRLSRINSWPLDPKDKRLGQYMHTNLHESVEAGIKFLRPVFSTDEETREYIKGVQKTIADTSVRTYCLW